ncbi:MAG: alpha-amylase, partial [Bacillota bacterium]
MSTSTDVTLRDAFIYQVFVRNHTEEGTFKALKKDLDRIRSLGVDILYLLPVHPIGEKHRKGDLGSPYSIR